MAKFVVASPVVQDGVGYLADGFEKPQVAPMPNGFQYVDSRHVGSMGPYLNEGKVVSDHPGEFEALLVDNHRAAILPVTKFADAFSQALGLDGDSSWFDIRCINYWEGLGGDIHQDGEQIYSPKGINRNDMGADCRGPMVSSRVSLVLPTAAHAAESTLQFPALRSEMRFRRQFRGAGFVDLAPEGAAQIQRDGAIAIYGHRMIHKSPETRWRPSAQIILEMRFPHSEAKALVIEHNKDPKKTVWPHGTTTENDLASELQIAGPELLTPMQQQIRSLMYNGIPGLDEYNFHVAIAELPEVPDRTARPVPFQTPISGPAFRNLGLNERWTRDGPAGGSRL